MKFLAVFVALFAAILPCSSSAQVLVAQDFLNEKMKKCSDNEVVVAQQVGGPGVLRVLNYRTQQWSERIVSNLPVRIESIDIGNVRGPGNSIVAGLERSYPGTIGAVRVFTYNAPRAAWDEEGLGLNIFNNVEALAVGDTDLNGKAEVIAGMEGNTYEPRIKLFRYNNGWTEENVSPLSYQPDIQYLSVSDLYGNGERVVLALAAFPPLGSGSMELRAFRKSNGIWSSHVIATNIGGLSRAERFVAANLDSDPELEIVVGMWNGISMVAGGLFMLDYDGSQWQTITMNSTLGAIDGIGVGSYSSAGLSDILVGTWRQVILYSRALGAWSPNIIIPATNAYMTWDADFGFLRELGNVGFVALDYRLVMLQRSANGTTAATTIRTMPSRIDSVQVGDVDGVRSLCELSDVSVAYIRANKGLATLDFP